MDYANGTELWKYQLDLIHNPETILLGAYNEEEGALKSDNELVEDILQKIRCAYASNRQKIFIGSNSRFVGGMLQSPQLHVQIYLPSKNSNNTDAQRYDTYYIEAKYKNDSKTSAFQIYDFGGGLMIHVPLDKCVIFESFIENSNFDGEYQKISNLLAENKSYDALKLLYSCSFCMYERLTATQKILLLKELSEKIVLSENYEEMVLNLIRSSHYKASKTEAQAICQYIMSPKVFERFVSGMDDFNGKANYSALIEEMTRLYAIAYPERIEASEKKIMERKGVYISSDLYYDWSHSFGRNIKLINGKYSIPFGRNVVDLYPSQVVNVFFGRDFDFVPPGSKRMVAMPAFALAYLLKHEQDKLVYGTAELIVTTYAMLSGVGEIIAVKNAATAVKVMAWAKLAKEVSFAVLSRKVVQDIIRREFPINGQDFLNMVEILGRADAIFSSSNSILVTKDVVDGFNSMMSTWSAILANKNVVLELGDDNIKKINSLLIEYKNILNYEDVVY